MVAKFFMVDLVVEEAVVESIINSKAIVMVPGHKSADYRQRKADSNPRGSDEVCMMAEEEGLGRCI